MSTNSNKNAASVNSSLPPSSGRSRSHRHVQEVIARIFAKRSASGDSRRHSEPDGDSADTEFHRR